MKKIIVIALLLLGGLNLRAAGVGNLRCEYMTAPLGVDVTAPHLSWIIDSDKRGFSQTAYQILVASSPELLQKNQGDVWDSGKVPSDRSVQVPYAGRPLQSFAKYYWKVRVWDNDGKPGKWSTPAFWGMGVLNPSDWGGARWIAYKDGGQWRKEWREHKEAEAKVAKLDWPWYNGKERSIWEHYEAANPHYDPAPLFRKEFAVDKKVTSATLYISGLGYYEAYLNGKRIGDHVLDPAWTNFHKRSFYVTYDLTGELARGNNALGIMLGRGQYNPLCNDIWKLNQSLWVDQPKTIALLRVEYADGTTSEVVTDGTWKTDGGPILYDDTRQGELYDARREQPGWAAPGFDAGKWKAASVVVWDAPLRSQMMPPVRCFDPIVPTGIYAKSQTRVVYDIKQNIAGWARVWVSGPAGAKVLVEYCELPSDRQVVPNIHPSKMIYDIADPDYASFYDKGLNLRQQNGYILKGEGTEIFECHFSYKGFQYIRVTTDPGVTVVGVEGIPVHTDVASAGGFSCSNPVINQIQKIARITMLNNFHSIPTDCPHREKQGWTADTYMTDQTAIYNFDMAAFYSKWLEDLAGTQDEIGGLCDVAPSTGYDQSISTVWPAAIVYVPLDIYGYYGDRRPMEQHYEVMKRFAESSLARQIDGKPEIIREVLGDWVSPKMELGDDLQKGNTMAPPEGLTLYGTASHYKVVKKLGEVARMLGREDEAREMDAWAARIAANFNKEFFDAKVDMYHGENPTEYRQAANIVPLEYGLVPEARYKAVLDNLKADIEAKNARIGTGFVGTMAMMDLLPVADPELAYRMATQPEYPGWAYMLRDGSTTMWETWDGGASRNHPPFCLISGYYYKHLAGIQCDPARPGFKHIVIDPSVVGDLKWVKGYHDSMYGRIVSDWTREGQHLTMDVTVPANCTATVCVPTGDRASVRESGKVPAAAAGVEFLREENGKALYKVGSGNYKFTADL